MRSAVIFTALALTAAVVVPRYAAQISAKPAVAALTVRPETPAAAAAATSRSVIVPRDSRGHFQVDARIEGRRLSFMVDTGASVIALTASDAGRLGLHPAQREFVVEVKTANGTVRAAPVRLDKVEVGDLAVRDVAALVMPDEGLSDNLLGLSFLSRLRRFEYSGGRLVLEQ
ncbi:MAG TPA: TIGR02281 family clan AA aspartic protease [Xanthobacteraceae bacterium]|nr:TIGR02281 family clan AA aspartic protease [Xanthobacteraceae bacterium]